MGTQNAVLHSIDYEPGIAVPVQCLIDQGISLEVVDDLLAKGVVAFSLIERPLAPVLRDCVQRSLDKAGLKGADIDTVILITESFGELFDSGEASRQTFRQIRNQTFELFYELGIHTASLFCATYGGCTNLLQAALMAKSIVQQGLGRHVLLVAAERFSSLDARLMQEAVSIAGDGVAACVVSAEAPGRSAFRLDFVSMAPYKNLLPGADMAAMLLAMFRSMKNAAADCYDACKMQPGDFRWVVLGDYNRNTTLTYSKLLGFAPDRTFLKNVGRLGHIPFDPLINLADLATTGQVHRHDSVLLFLCGPVSCGAISVTVC